MLRIQWLITSLIALAGVSIAGFGAYIANRQRHTARYKLKLDLFGFRFKVFEAAKALLDRVIATGVPDLDALENLNSTVAQSQFLFPKELTDHLDQVRTRVLQQRNIVDQFNAVAGKKAVKEGIAEEKAANLQWLEIARKNLAERFRPYVDFRDIK